jgi:hypothetical protein
MTNAELVRKIANDDKNLAKQHLLLARIHLSKFSTWAAYAGLSEDEVRRMVVKLDSFTDKLGGFADITGK